MRLDKFLAHNGFGSRKDVKILIKKKLVKVNGEIVRDSSLILNIAEDQVFVDDKQIHFEKDIYYMMNKPAGYICAHDAIEYPSALELIEDYHNDLIFVGRLDVDTEGLLVITNDGQFSHRIAHGKRDVDKQYYVELERDFDSKYLEHLEKGIPLDDGILKPASLEIIDAKTILLTIAEGKYHQVKRMMHFCENEVKYLKRVRIGKLHLDPDLKPGHYRKLSQNEIDYFNN